MFQARFSLVVVLALVASTALAGPLGSDPAGLEGFTGSVSFNADDILLVDLDYAVFAPGNYPDDGVNGNDPSDGSEYVYAYQAFNVSSSEPLTSITVGLAEDSGAGNAGWDPLHEMVGGVNPLVSNILSTSFVTTWVPQILAGQFSSVFLFTSPNPPTFAPTSVQNGGHVDQQMAPSPLPEPGTLGFFGLASLIAFRRRRT